VLTKPGGMTTSEVMVMGKPMVLLAPAPGKEEVQAERLAADGVAIYEQDPQRAVQAALQVIADAEVQQRMLAAVGKRAHPDAAREVAASLARAARESAKTSSSWESRK
jgi:processive 1,2-diacylglycerol beta-glucosyltransferase